MTISNRNVATNGYFTYLLTYLLTYFMRDVRDPGFWARTPAGYDYNVYLEYLLILYLLN